jgi:eukaryotic-like serine/threonine-protein kinase
MRPQDPFIGRDILDGQFQILQKIGSGGMGAVYKALQPAMNRMVGVKILHPKLANRKDLTSRFRREARAMSHLSHPNTVKVFLYGELDDGSLYIVMEFLEGKNLNQTVRADGPFPVERALPVLIQVCGALDEAHTQGIIHRDLKPENILLTPLDARFPVRVIDWGIALQDAGARYTRHDEAIGTPTYMAPEQARGAPTHGACDVYGLGVVAYHALCGRPPFTGKTSVEILVQHLHKPVPELAPRCPGAPRELIALIERMLAKHPDDRPSAEQVQATLVELQGGCVAGELEEPATVRLRRIAVE